MLTLLFRFFNMPMRFRFGNSASDFVLRNMSTHTPNPWKVMQARQPIWTNEDEKRLAEKSFKENLRYKNLSETINEENDEEEGEE